MIIWGSSSYCELAISLFGFGNTSSKIYIIDPFVRSPETIFFDKLSVEASLYNHLPSLPPQNFFIAIGNNYGFHRCKYADYLVNNGHNQLKLWHHTAFIADSTQIKESTVLMPRTTIMPFVSIGSNCIINTAATIDHETTINDGVHVMGSAYIAGRVRINSYSTIGSNATIFPDVTIGSNVFVGAGAVVRHDIPDNTIFVGNPAKYLKKNKELPSNVKYNFSD